MPSSRVWLFAAFSFVLCIASANADPLLYVSDGFQFGTVNASTGAFQQIGPGLPEGAMGLADCSTPMSPYGPTSGNTIAMLGRNISATGFQSRLYSVNSSTGAATAIGLTGVPALPFIPLSSNPDGTINIYDEALFAAGGKLYAFLMPPHWILIRRSSSPLSVQICTRLTPQPDLRQSSHLN